MSEKKNKNIAKVDNENKSKTNVVANEARRAEHRCLTALSSYAEKTNSLEVTRPSATNCPDGGHDIDVTGVTDEVKELVSTVTGTDIKNLSFLDDSEKKGKLKVRIDVKNGKTISGDTIDKHAADSSRSADCQVNLLMLTNPNVKVTPEAKKRLKRQKELFRENGTLVDITSTESLQEIEKRNNSLSSNSDD